MQNRHSPNSQAPLLCWDFFCAGFNQATDKAESYLQSVTELKQIARSNKWSRQQTQEVLKKLLQQVVVVTDPTQQILFTGRGFYEMTGYTSYEVKGKNPKFLQGPGTDKKTVAHLRSQLAAHKAVEVVLQNYRRDGEPYLCKVFVQPVINSHRKLVNYIAYEQEIAA